MNTWVASRAAPPKYDREVTDLELEDGTSERVSEAFACPQCEQPGIGVLQTE